MTDTQLIPSDMPPHPKGVAKTKSNVELAKEELICPLCMGFFDNPFSLQCLHSYCEVCLIGLHRSTAFAEAVACPECRAKTLLPEEGIKGLKPNFKLKRFVEILTTEEKEEFIRKTRSFSIPQSLKCITHTDKSLEYYCASCKEVACGQCMLEEHRSHQDVTYAKEVIPKHIEELKKLIPRAETVISNGKLALEVLERNEEELCAKGNEELVAVHQYFVNLQQVLKKRETEIVEDMQERMNHKETLLQKRKQTLQKNIDSVKMCRTTIENMEANRCEDICVLMEEPSVRMRLETHSVSVESEIRRSIESDYLIDFSFVPDPNFESLCKSVGDLQSPKSLLSPTQLQRHFTTGSDVRKVKFQPQLEEMKLSRGSHSAPSSPKFNTVESRTHKLPDSNQKRPHSTQVSLSSDISSSPSEFRRRLATYSPEKLAKIVPPIIEVSTKNLLGTTVMGSPAIPHGVCVGKDNIILVSDIKNCVVRILVSTGRFLEVIGSEGKGDGQFTEPIAVTTNELGHIFVVDKGSPSRIQKFSPEGKFLMKFKTRGLIGGNYLGDPLGIAVMEDGTVLVTDNEKSCIHQFDKSGKYQGRFGCSDVLIRNPAGIVVHKQGRVVVTDRGDHCVWIFTTSGQLLTRFGRQGYYPGEFHYPYGVALDHDGYIYISESGNHRISKFTAVGKLVKCFGRKGSEPGMFLFPRHLCVDSQGRLIVADEQNQRLQIFSCSD